MPTVTRAQLLEFAQSFQGCSSLRVAARKIRRFASTLPDGDWKANFQRLALGLETGHLAHRILTLEGNSKLPYACFSTLPIATCPGAGECAEWCYSLRGWQYPGSFCRQLQNTLLMRLAPGVIAKAFRVLPHGITVRLYVDGDFENERQVDFWMNLVGERNDLVVYGYSKSWAQLLEHDRNGGTWPENYVLNISNGGKFDSRGDWILAMEALPIVRGRFSAVKIDTKGIPKGFKRYDSADYHKRVREVAREEFGKRVVSCTGKCGECGTGGIPWCADKKLIGITIAIGAH